MSKNGNTSQLARRHGITCEHELMPNGELRFRLFGPDGNGYVRTEAGVTGAWQNSHFHHRVRETYIVESGWMVLAVLDNDGRMAKLSRYGRGAIVTTSVEVRHNVYLPASAIIHTVKHGGTTGEPDWHGAPDLDAMTRHLSEVEILRKSRNADDASSE